MMEIKIGCDIVSLAKFKRSAQRSKPRFLGKIFSSSELAGTASVESLAGMFAAKEAVIKALELKAGDWHKIEIVKNKSGRPEIMLRGINREIASHDISISHDREYAIAFAVFLIPPS